MIRVRRVGRSVKGSGFDNECGGGETSGTEKLVDGYGNTVSPLT